MPSNFEEYKKSLENYYGAPTPEPVPPPAINQPSGAFQITTGDENSIAPHTDVIPEACKPPLPIDEMTEAEQVAELQALDAELPPAPEPEKPKVIEAPAPKAEAVVSHPVHPDGTNAQTFVGTIPGTTIRFSNPGRSDGRPVRTQLSSTIKD